MERCEILALLDNQRKHFNDALQRMEQKCMNAQEKQDKRINEITASLEYSQKQLEEALIKLKHVSDEKKEFEKVIQTLAQENQNLKDEIINNESRLDYIDDQSRRNNLRIVGIPEEQGENWEQCQMKVTKLIEEKLNIPEVNMERAHRIGKNTGQRTRDIVAKFVRFPERNAVFRARSKLKGTNIYINEDFCPGTVDVRRKQMDRMREARRNGKQAFFNYRTLIVRDYNRGERGYGSRQVGMGRAPSPASRTPPRTPQPTTPRTPPRTLLPSTPVVSPKLTTTTAAAITATANLTWSEVARASPARDAGGEELGATSLSPQPPEYRRQLRDRNQPNLKNK